MELIQILLIIIIVIVLLGFFTIKDKSNFLNRVDYKCPNCSSNTWLGEDACYSCNECGWCVDPYGNGSCARGNEYGPLFKQCQSWSYNGECMWGPDCGNNGQIYITDHNTNPYPWYLRWFWPRYRTDYYDDYEDTNGVHTVNNYNYHINKYKKKNKLRKKIRRLRRKNKQLIKKHELPNLIKPIIIKKRNMNQTGGGNVNQLNIKRENRQRESKRRQSRRMRRQSRRRQSRRRQSRRRQSSGRQTRRRQTRRRQSSGRQSR